MLIVILIASAALPYTSNAQQVDEQFGLAAGHYERQEYEQATVAFRELIAAYPNTSQASASHFFLAESLVQQVQYQSAYPAYQLFVKANPNHAFAKRAEFRMAECAFRINWDEQATTQFEKFVQRYAEDPLNEFALNYLGELRLRRNEPQLAQAVFESAIQKYPYSSQSNRNRFGLAKALHKQGNTQEALRFYEMLTTNASNPMYSRALLQIGIIHFSDGDFELADESLTLVLDIATDEAERNEALFWSARTDLAQSENSSALEKYNEIIDKPFSGDLQAAVLFDAAIAASRTGELEQAIDWLTKLQTTWPKSAWADDATQLKIELLYRNKQLEKAQSTISSFKSQFTDHPNLPVIGEIEGRIQYDQGQFDQTLKTFEDLLTRFGNGKQHQNKIGQWNYFLGLGYLGKREYESAAKHFAMIDLNGQPNQFRGSVLLAQSSAAVALDREQEAIVFLEKYLSTNPTGSSADRARADLAFAYTKLDRWDEAKKTLSDLEDQYTDLDTVLETRLLMAEYALADKHFAYSEECFAGLTDDSYPRKYVVRGLSGLAWVRMSRGQQDSSVEVFGKIIQEHGDSEFAAESAMVLGRYFERNGNYVEAMRMYDMVLEKYSVTDFARLASLRRGYCLHQIGGEENLAQAQLEIQQYLTANKDYLDEAHYQLAWLYLDGKDEVKAMNHFWEVATNHNESKFWSDSAYRVAQWQLKENNYSEAKQLAEKLIVKDSTADAIKQRCEFLLGQIAVQEQNWPSVETKMRAVLAETDDESLRMKTRYWLAESMFQQGQYEDALVDLEKLVANPALTTNQRQAWVALRRSQTYAYLDRWTEALNSATAGKTQYPNFEAIHEFDFVRGRAHGSQGRLADARIAYQDVIDSATGRMTQTAAMAQWRIGETHFHAEDYESAIKSYYMVDSLYAYEKWRAAALIEAGKCQEHLGNWKHAMKLYQQLIDKFPTSDFRVAAEQRLGTATRQAARTKDSIKK